MKVRASGCSLSDYPPLATFPNCLQNIHQKQRMCKALACCEVPRSFKRKLGSSHGLNPPDTKTEWEGVRNSRTLLSLELLWERTTAGAIVEVLEIARMRRTEVQSTLLSAGNIHDKACQGALHHLRSAAGLEPCLLSSLYTCRHLGRISD